MTVDPRFVTCNREVTKLDRMNMILVKVSEYNEPPTPEEVEFVEELFAEIADAIKPIAEAIMQYMFEVTTMVKNWYDSLPEDVKQHINESLEQAVKSAPEVRRESPEPIYMTIDDRPALKINDPNLPLLTDEARERIRREQTWRGKSH